MNVLIVGNGFDLAHKLPTRYEDFLDFIKEFKEVFENKGVLWVEGKAMLSRNASQNLVVFCENGEEVCTEFCRVIYNVWIDYFERSRDKIGTGWLGFENEIERVVKSLIEDKKRGNIQKGIVYSNTIMDVLLRNAGCIDLESRFLFLTDELKKTCRALELYMDGLINHLKTGIIIPEIKNLSIDKLISFNYTCTFTENYIADIEYSYIHGRANSKNGAEKSNIVLGFDDHYFEKAQTIPEIIPFEKYYQRIVNRTDVGYFRWISADESLHNYFYGHSLSPADGDVIRRLVMVDNATTTIYFMNDKDRAEKVKNLAVILGPDKLIEKAGGTEPAICFERIDCRE